MSRESPAPPPRTECIPRTIQSAARRLRAGAGRLRHRIHQPASGAHLRRAALHDLNRRAPAGMPRRIGAFGQAAGGHDGLVAVQRHLHGQAVQARRLDQCIHQQVIRQSRAGANREAFRQGAADPCQSVPQRVMAVRQLAMHLGRKIGQGQQQALGDDAGDDGMRQRVGADSDQKVQVWNAAIVIQPARSRRKS